MLRTNDGGGFSRSQTVDKFDVNVVVNRHSVGHVSQPGFVGIHIVCVALVIDDGFTEIDFGTVFAAHVEVARMTIILDGFVVLGIQGYGVFFIENALNAGFEEIVVGFEVVAN